MSTDAGSSDSEKLIKYISTTITTIATLGPIGVLSGYGVLHGYLSHYTDLPLLGMPLQSYFVAGASLASITVPVIILTAIAVKLIQSIPSLAEFSGLAKIVKMIEAKEPLKQDAALNQIGQDPEVLRALEKLQIEGMPKADEKFRQIAKTLEILKSEAIPQSSKKAIEDLLTKMHQRRGRLLIQLTGLLGIFAIYMALLIRIFLDLPLAHQQLIVLIIGPYLICVALYTVFVPDSSRRWYQKLGHYLVRPSALVLDAPKSIIAALTLFLCIFGYALLISQIYGANLYSKVALSFGGGMPAKVEIIFKESPDALKFDFLKPSTLTTNNQPGDLVVCLLTYLGDDVMVYAPSEKITATIPKDQILIFKDEYTDPDPTMSCNPPTP